MPKKVKKRHLLDYSILIPYLILCVLGLIMVYSSTSYLLLENGQNPSASVINQSILGAQLDCYRTTLQNENRCFEKPAFDYGSHRSFDDFAADRCVFR